MWISSREEDQREPGHSAGAPDRTLLSRGHQRSERGNRLAAEERSATRRGRMRKRLREIRAYCLCWSGAKDFGGRGESSRRLT